MAEQKQKTAQSVSPHGKQSGALNLARRLRPRTFDEVVGQDLSVSMLRNSLYKNHFFPVYLFSGQKGCGKTTSARIFATAANCENLEKFQEAPEKTKLPCLSCQSCTMMGNNQHPDFIEIDAASHTGVDDVRNLLESSAFVPLVGSKKLYLIDEAHMLSRAAFNALLKILEEPPPAVIFMLATTEVHKIPETVRSRCFQLLFNALPHKELVSYIGAVCESEEISYEPEALDILVRETDCSARDALNLLEQLRFGSEKITPELVEQMVGSVSSNQLFDLLCTALSKKPDDILRQLEKNNFASKNPAKLWGGFIQLCRAGMHGFYGINSETSLTADQVKKLKEICSLNRLHAVMQLLWREEELFLQTPYKHQLFENILLQISEQTNVPDISEVLEAAHIINREGFQAAPVTQTQAQTRNPARSYSSPSTSNSSTSQPAPTRTQSAPEPKPSKPIESGTQIPNTPEGAASPSPSAWAACVNELGTLSDQMLKSLISQATVSIKSGESGKKILELGGLNPFAHDYCTEQIQSWKPIIQKHFPDHEIRYTRGEKKKSEHPVVHSTPRPAPPPPQAPAARQPEPAQSGFQKRSYGGSRSVEKKKPARTSIILRGTPLVLTPENQDSWPQANLLVSVFPGRLEAIKLETES